jgi:acetyl-CoA carboxylase carboxyl transferase subunit beta
MFLDEGSHEEIGKHVKPVDPLKFKDSKRYKDRVVQAQKQTKENDALVVMKGQLKGRDIVAAAFDFGFMGVYGFGGRRKFVRGVNKSWSWAYLLLCLRPVAVRVCRSRCFLVSDGETSAVLTKLSDAGLRYFVYDRSDYGRRFASLAMLGDINVAEPNALIGFAGPRVIEQTVREKLPEGFQRSEFLQEHGAIDMIIDRREMRDKIAAILSILMAGSDVAAQKLSLSSSLTTAEAEDTKGFQTTDDAPRQPEQED